MKNKEIAIIGGGIAGLTFSICMRNSDYQCHIFEKETEFREVGAAISVFPNALWVMKELGLLDEILANSGKVKEVYLKTASGKVLTKTEPDYDLPMICMHRADLQRILLKHTTANLYNNFSLKSINTLTKGKTEITFENGEVKNFDAVIGADGIHSVVRKYIINDGDSVYRGYNIWRGVCETDFNIGYGSETYGKGKRVGIVPLKDGKYGWWATFNEDFMKDDQPEGTKQKLERLFGDWHFPIPELINATDNILKNSSSDRVPQKGWTKGMVTLLGDAAHPTTPNLGQGGCIAIEGAYILSKAVKKYGLSADAFSRYEHLQFKRSKTVMEESLRLGKIGQIENPLVIFFRNLTFKLMPARIVMKLMDKFFSYKVTELKI